MASDTESDTSTTTISSEPAPTEDMPSHPLAMAEALNTPLETYCLALVRTIRHMQNEAARTSRTLAETQTATRKSHKRLKQVLQVKHHLEDQLCRVSNACDSLQEARDDWRAKYQRVWADLQEALRCMAETQAEQTSIAPPPYDSDNVITYAGNFESIPDLVMQRHVQILARAHLHQNTFASTAFEALGTECRQLCKHSFNEPTFATNMIFLLTSQTLGFLPELPKPATGVEWLRIQVQVLQHWRALDDMLLALLKRLMNGISASSNSRDKTCDRVICGSCQQDAQWMTLSVRLATLRHYSDQLRTVCSQVRRTMPETLASYFLQDSYEWIERTIHKETSALPQSSARNCYCSELLEDLHQAKSDSFVCMRSLWKNLMRYITTDRQTLSEDV